MVSALGGMQDFNFTFFCHFGRKVKEAMQNCKVVVIGLTDLRVDGDKFCNRLKL